MPHDAQPPDRAFDTPQHAHEPAPQLTPEHAATNAHPPAWRARTWVDEANHADADFPLASLPLGRFETDADAPRWGLAIGHRVIDLARLASEGVLDWPANEPTLQTLALHGTLPPPRLLRALRERVRAWLTDGAPDGPRARAAAIPLSDVRLLLPCRVGNYTDFYASIHHARTVGSMFRPDNPLLPNYTHVPIGYHGRASSVVASGTPIRRPRGQIKPDDSQTPVHAPTNRLDLELELGCIIGAGNALGEPVSVAGAPAHVAGLALVNDWSARDVQAWEYQPLGPFLAKNFATTLSPWIVPLEALAPYRVPGPPRAAGEPAPLAYLHDPAPWALDLTLEWSLRTARMREEGLPAQRVARVNFRDMFWTIPQLIAHHTTNGCNLRPGDLLASGTVSGPSPDQRGCLLEATWRGSGPDGKPLPRQPISLPTGESRVFLADGDEVILTGFADPGPDRPNARRIGLGECRGIITPALT